MSEKAIKAARDAINDILRRDGIASSSMDLAEAAIAAYEKAMWRPIEEAPKDGTIIDVWLGDAEPADIDFYCTPGTRRSCGWSWRDGKFRPLGGLSATMPTFVQPTHFRHLPKPEGI